MLLQASTSKLRSTRKIFERSLKSWKSFTTVSDPNNLELFEGWLP